AQDKRDKALEEAAGAEGGHEQTLRARSNSAIPAAAEDEAATWKAPAADPDLFANLEHYEAEDEEKLLKLRSDMGALASLLEKARKQYTGSAEAKKQRLTMPRNARHNQEQWPQNQRVNLKQIHRRRQQDRHLRQLQRSRRQRKERLDSLTSDAKTRAVARARGLLLLLGAVISRGGTFSNITQWGPRAHEYINEGGADMGIFMMCETRMPRGKLNQAKVGAANNGWKMAGAAAVPAKRFVKAPVGPWVTLADWKAPCEDIAKTGFAQQIGGAFIKPDVEVTCDAGNGSLRDYGITRTDFIDKVKLQELATPAKPKKKAYPNSERREWELSGELKFWGGDLIIRGQRHRSAEAAATRMHAEWATCLEEPAIIADEIAEEAGLHRGRAGGFEVKWVKARSTPGRTRVQFGPAEQWGILNAILVLYRALHTNGTDGRQQAKCLADAKTQSRALQNMGQPFVFGKKYGE
ncbi:unnamed protein product, partial [Prorocentrum cordatum]